MNKQLIILSLLLVIEAPTYAATSIATPKATATLTSSCSISATNVDMGDISQLINGQPGLMVQAGSGNVSVVCNKQTPYIISLNLGANTDSVQRLLKDSNGNAISYGICKTTSLSESKGCVDDWYTGNGYNYTVSGVGTGQSQLYPMYGALRKNYYTPGTYSDTITATLTY